MAGPLLSLLLLAATTTAPDVERAIQALVDGRTRAPHGQPLFPVAADVVSAELTDGVWQVRVDGDFASLARSEELEELRRESVLGALSAWDIQGGVVVQVKDAAGAWSPLFPHRPDVPPTGLKRAPRTRGDGMGALSGKRIAISAGHGWLDQNGSWGTQRSRWDFVGCGNCRGITEDFFTAELATNFVIPLLQRMGATVVVVREPDHLVTAPLQLSAGGVDSTEEGAWMAATGGGVDGDHRTLASGSAGSSRFSITVGSAESRRVAFRFVGGADRTSAATVLIEDLGGAHTLVVDQRRNGDAWGDLGPFWFAPGVGSMTISPSSATGILDVDAIKVGGGMFAPSGKPWWQMGAATYVPQTGAPGSVTTYGDVSIRPAYAEHVDADLYVSIHANAAGVTGGSSANGMSLYRYSCQAYADHSTSTAATGCDDPPGSTDLINLVHAELMARIRADWDPNFGDRNRRVANFGELRTLADMPGILVETAFFDNTENPSGTPPPRYADNRSLHDPRWREAFAYGLVSGLARYFDPLSGAPPIRPVGVAALNNVDGSMTISWDAVPGATGYRLYQATTGRAFNSGINVATTSLTLTDPAPGTVLTFRVAAVNANGEGLPSQGVTARFRGARMARPAHALLVTAYDRRDAWVQEPDNDFLYSVEHGQSISRASGMDIYFDGATDEVLETARVTLGNYRLLDVQTGKDSTADRPLSKTLQGLLRTFVAAGGALLVSGEEIGFALVQTSSDPDEEAFVLDVLGASYVEDDAQTQLFSGTATGPFAGLGDTALDDGTGGVFEVVYPDVLAAATNGTMVLQYSGGRGAAIATERTIFVGAPLEAVVPESARNQVFSRAMRYLLPDVGSGDLDEDGASDACEMMYGLNARDAADGALDADSDGRSNAQECQEGTDPNAGADGGVTTLDAGMPSDAAAQVPDAGVEPPDAGMTVTDPPDASAIPAGGGGDAPPPEERRIGPFPAPECGCTATESSDTPWALLVGGLLVALRRRRW